MSFWEVYTSISSLLETFLLYSLAFDGFGKLRGAPSLFSGLGRIGLVLSAVAVGRPRNCGALAIKVTELENGLVIAELQ